MEKRERYSRFLLVGGLILLMLLLMAGWSILDAQEEEVQSKKLSVSLESGFYTQSQVVKATAKKGTTIYYTDNCEEPNKDNSHLYTEPITIPVTDEEQVYVYRFKAYYKDGTESDVITRVYFVGSQVDGRYTTNVLHITGDPEELYGYEEGIFALGKRYDEYMAANPGAEYGPDIDANFFLKGEEYERAVHIEYFDSEGNSLLDMNGGIRVHGALTRLKNQKSFRLYARKEYDEQNEFDYPVLSGLISEETGTVAKQHKRLVVRNAGNDNGYAFIRSELVARLASEAGFPDVTQAEPVCVYINGTYQGIYWIENTFDAQYFENRYGEYTGEFVVLEGGDPIKVADEDETTQQYVEEYNRLYAEFAAMDMTVDANYEALQQVLDVENYLQYFVIQNYVGNMDWPDNNVKVYRYVAADGKYTENSVFDGRYRQILYDADYGFGILDFLGYNAWTHLLPTIYEQAPLFAALMEREDCRAIFINETCDLMNGAMSAEHVSEVLEQMHEERAEELYYMLEETNILEGSWGWEEDISTHYDIVEESCADIRRFAEERPTHVLNDMIDCFGLDAAQAYTLTLTKDCYSQVQINSLCVEDAEFVGVYMGNVPVDITPVLAKNEVFAYWMVNGEKQEEETVQLTTQDIVNAEITVELVVEEVEEPVLQIAAVRAKGKSDYIELINLSKEPISTQGYFLSDSEDLYQYSLPNMTIQPGEVRRFYGKNSTDIESLNQLSLNFNIKQGETVSLTHVYDTLETLLIPDLSENGVYTRIGVSDRFVEVLE